LKLWVQLLAMSVTNLFCNRGFSRFTQHHSFIASQCVCHLFWTYWTLYLRNGRRTRQEL